MQPTFPRSRRRRTDQQRAASSNGTKLQPEGRPTTETKTAPQRRRRRWLWVVVGAVVAVLLVGLVAGPFVYIHFIQGDPPPRLTFENADATVATTSPSKTAAASTATTTVGTSTSVDGTWSATDASQVGYRVKEVLFGQSTEAVGRSNSVTGQLTLSGTTATAASFTVDVASIKSDDAGRDGQFTGRIMQTSTYPTATFGLAQPIDLGSLPVGQTEITVRATGDLTLRGVTKSVTFNLSARRKGDNIEASGTIPVEFSDYGIPNPSTSGASTGDNGVIEFLLVFARG
jgi:polyisoprenoid-binding protein YceI